MGVGSQGVAVDFDCHRLPVVGHVDVVQPGDVRSRYRGYIDTPGAAGKLSGPYKGTGEGV
jgi:hypothetical protein